LHAKIQNPRSSLSLRKGIEEERERKKQLTLHLDQLRAQSGRLYHQTVWTIEPSAGRYKWSIIPKEEEQSVKFDHQMKDSLDY
jgi:hypothetical protein